MTRTNNLLVIATQSFFLSIIPIPTNSLVDDIFISILIGTVLCAYGTSLFFKGRGSGGGSDIIGLWLTKNGKGSVGKVYTIVNMTIYIICLVVYNYEIALYSTVHSLILSFILDRIHEDNIETAVLIITENKELKSNIMCKYNRGMTEWSGSGVYTGQQNDMLLVCMTKNQVLKLKKDIKENYVDSFMIVFDNIKVEGKFPKVT